MKRFSSIGRQNCPRWILIFGVLTGLFFSGGEGIQLFPFPVTEVNSSKISASVREESSKSYAFSVYSYRNYSTFLKAKFQKHANLYLSGEYFTFHRSETRANFCLPPAQNRREINFLRRAPVADSQSKRAPPAA
jgi:hypothetical protein